LIYVKTNRFASAVAGLEGFFDDEKAINATISALRKASYCSQSDIGFNNHWREQEGNGEGGGDGEDAEVRARAKERLQTLLQYLEERKINHL
jgi:preprotein translocase subunit Sec61beta